MHVFVSYSRQDRAWKDRVLVFLNGLKRAGRLDSWNDTQIRTGEIWEDEVRDAILRSDGRDHEILDKMQIFKTKRQHTWLVAVRGKIVCLLDDENTRKAGRVIQWRQRVGSQTQVSARRMPGGPAFLLDVGRAKRWLASPGLFGNDPSQLETQVRALVDAAANPS